jgi:hypothetical protein
MAGSLLHFAATAAASLRAWDTYFKAAHAEIGLGALAADGLTNR